MYRCCSILLATALTVAAKRFFCIQNFKHNAIGLGSFKT